MEHTTSERTHHHHHHHGSKRKKPVAKSKFSLTLNVGIGLNCFYAAAALFLGFRAASIGLISDALFTVTNVCGIAVALSLHRMMVFKDKPSKSYRFRYQSIHLKLISIALMLLAAGALAFEAMRRINLPIADDDTLALPDGNMMLKVALGGVVLHALTAVFLMMERKHNSVAGTPTAFWLSTVLSAVTAVAGVIVLKAEDDLFDNVAALFGAVLMALEAVTLLYPVLRFSMGGATDRINRDYVKSTFQTHGNVRGFGHMHIMAINNKEMALMAHVSLFHPEQAATTFHELKTSFYKLGLNHVTLELSKNDQPDKDED